MSVEVNPLRKELAREIAAMKANDGNVCLCGESGPPSFKIIELLLDAVESQQKQIDALRKRLDTGDVRAGA